MLVFPMWVASILGSTNIGDAAGAVSRSQSYSGGANGAVEARSTGENTAARRLRTELGRRASSDGNHVCLDGMAEIEGQFCVDRYEGSLVEILADGTEQPWPYYRSPTTDVVTKAVSVPGVYPQGYISGVQASAACEASGKRLCSPREWKSACMGPRKTTFPYGSERQTGRCNDNGRSSLRFYNPQLDDKPEHRWMWGAGGNMNDPRLNQMPGTLTRTGERAECTNEYGVFDMVGNLHEWVDDPDGTFQGGYYLDTHVNGDGCNYRTTAHPSSHHDYSTGFRCCADRSSQ
ncbi:MAG: SUMF1/EgtB/PvdO family nonheme iron enzyme [Polyangiaceae bacterium]